MVILTGKSFHGKKLYRKLPPSASCMLKLFEMDDSKKPENFEKVILLLAEKLKGLRYAFRGTASLVLQGLDMIALDIDITGDKEMALACNDLLAEYLVEEVAFKESEKYKSYFGKFEIDGVPVEVMAEWQIKDTKGVWSEPFDGSERKLVELDKYDIYVTTVEEELAVFAKMGRWNAFHKIKRQIKKSTENQPALF